MSRESAHDLLVFIAVARKGSFTRAASQLRVSQSPMSHTKGVRKKVRYEASFPSHAQCHTD